MCLYLLSSFLRTTWESGQKAVQRSCWVNYGHVHFLLYLKLLYCDVLKLGFCVVVLTTIQEWWASQPVLILKKFIHSKASTEIIRGSICRHHCCGDVRSLISPTQMAIFKIACSHCGYSFKWSWHCFKKPLVQTQSSVLFSLQDEHVLLKELPVAQDGDYWQFSTGYVLTFQ